MCKLTILRYTQCNCDARDGSDEAGLIVTKDWHNRLPLDRDAVPFERCLQAKSYAVNTSKSVTTEFSPCDSVQASTVYFEEEACFRCLMHRRSKERAEQIRALVAERGSYLARHAMTRQSAAKHAKASESMWQSIRASTERKFDDLMSSVRANQVEPVDSTMEDWVIRVESQIVNRAKRLERQGQIKVGAPSPASQEQEEKRKQARLARLRLCLIEANTRAVSPDSETTLNGSPPLGPQEKEQSSASEGNPARSLRVARTATRPSRGFGPRLDVMVSAQLLQSSRDREEVSPQILSPSSILPCSETTATRAMVLPRRNRIPMGYRTVCTSRAIQILGPKESASNGTRTPPAVKAASIQEPTALSPEASEFKPFRELPPTEPRSMRVPSAPRAMRESGFCSLPRMNRWSCQQYATVRGYSTVRGWRR